MDKFKQLVGQTKKVSFSSGSESRDIIRTADLLRKRVPSRRGRVCEIPLTIGYYLQRCTQTGIEQHIKRAQLRWSGHLVRMADDRITKDVFYGELDAGHRTRGGQRKRYKDVLKATLKSCGIPHMTWESTATDRALWRSTCHSGLRDYEEKRCDTMRDKRKRRKAIQPSSNIDTFLCHVCGRLCASRIGLHSHNRTHANTNTD